MTWDWQDVVALFAVAAAAAYVARRFLPRRPRPSGGGCASGGCGGCALSRGAVKGCVETTRSIQIGRTPGQPTR